MKAIMFTLLLITLSCDSSTIIVTPDGGKGVAVDCNFGGREHCLQEISRVCPHGYTIAFDSVISGYMEAYCK